MEHEEIPVPQRFRPEGDALPLALDRFLARGRRRLLHGDDVDRADVAVQVGMDDGTAWFARIRPSGSYRSHTAPNRSQASRE